MADPTRTTKLRNDASRTVVRRFEPLEEFVSDPLLWVPRPFETNDEMISRFELNVDRRIDRHIVDEERGLESLAWLSAFMMAAYGRGVGRATGALPQTGLHAEVRHMIRRRIFSQMVGVTQKLKNRLADELSRGILAGLSVDEISSNLREITT